tara:strand:- start:128 stop:463 length:336 start_codon:yes stop_codon:yes gene_type:complete
MTTFLIIIGLLAVAAGVYFYAIKTGKIEDKDGDLIADDIEEAIEDAKDVAAEVKRRAKNVKSELADVKKAAKELGEQLEDVAEAAAGKPRRGRKPSKGSKGAKKTTTRKKK